MIDLYDELNLPKSLNEMLIYEETVTAAEKVAAFIDSKEKVHLLPFAIDQDLLKNSIFDLERYIEKKGMG